MECVRTEFKVEKYLRGSICSSMIEHLFWDVKPWVGSLAPSHMPSMIPRSIVFWIHRITSVWFLTGYSQVCESPGPNMQVTSFHNNSAVNNIKIKEAEKKKTLQSNSLKIEFKIVKLIIWWNWQARRTQNICFKTSISLTQRVLYL